MAGRRGQAKRRRGRVLANVLIVVGISLLAVAGGVYLYNWYRYHEQDVENERLAEYATPASEGASEGPQVDWEGLKAINPDVVGWIQIPGTVVNYPVYQADDNDYYLHHNADGATSFGGQVFLDCLSSAPGLVDAQSVLYGHHLRNGTMFQPVSLMDDQATFDACDTVWYVTEQASFELEPLLLYYTTPDDSTVRTFSFQDEDAFHAYLAERLARAQTSRADAESILAVTEHVLTLSTCNYYDGYGRTELVCVPKSEAERAADGISS